MAVEQDNSLWKLIIICAVLLTSLVAWCILSTCMGGPILRSMRNTLGGMVDSTEQRMEARDRRRRAGMNEPGEEWEMGRTRRNPMLT
ncbi:hypothetical protein BDV93DRAFT_272138 [Ceratobasidium sp. AG-I]|nr:hypothetical protein BDV93DRAFT_272138 [Ceratobasidium sp. AG-I]